MTIKVRIPERSPSTARLRAQLRAATSAPVEEPADRRAPPPVSAPGRKPLPNVPPMSLGQAARVSILVLVGFGFAQLPQAEKARAEKANVPASLASAK